MNSFGSRYDGCKELVFNYLLGHYSSGLDCHEIEDAFQTASSKAFTNYSTFREESEFSTWFTTIARNEALMLLRKKSTGIRSITDELEQDLALEILVLDSPLFEQDDYEILNDLIASLDDKYSSVISRVLEGYSYKQISDEFDLPVNTVKTRFHRGKKKIL